MIKVNTLINLLKKNNTNFFTGVPDSVLKQLSSSLQSVNKKNHIIATGYNGNPSGFIHCINKPCQGANSPQGEDLDKCEAIHAEQNALLQCKNVYEIDRVYTTLEPCVHCTKLLLNTSANQIIYGEKYVHDLSRKLWESSGRGYTYINLNYLIRKTN